MDWRERCWISLGGVAGTALLAMGTLLWYVRNRRPSADAVLAGVLLVPCLYTIRFVLAGRKPDGIEWIEAQSALGAAPAGHTVDFLFLYLALAAIAAWVNRQRSALPLGALFRAAGLLLAGMVLLVALQGANNALFDRFFPRTTTVNIPAGFASPPPA